MKNTPLVGLVSNVWGAVQIISGFWGVSAQVVQPKQDFLHRVYMQNSGKSDFALSKFIFFICFHFDVR
ncbi:MAG: hypothetical protein LBE58_13870 [Comamonas sp.]|jgi:amino acid permease|nr:hypothetical protein [Comamonas sp.]